MPNFVKSSGDVEQQLRHFVFAFGSCAVPIECLEHLLNDKKKYYLLFVAFSCNLIGDLILNLCLVRWLFILSFISHSLSLQTHDVRLMGR